MTLLSPIAALLVALLVIAYILRSRVARSIQDIPNERSLHVAPTPRVGGIGLMLGVLAGWSLLATELPWWLLLPLLLVFVVSLLDDVRGLSVRLRLPVHLLASAVLVLGGGFAGVYGWPLAVIAVLAVVWMTNLYNFMDGSDGLAGGMALVGFGVYGLAALASQHEAMATLNFAIAAAALGFLRYNFPPAKIFMGDAGSIPLGFLAAALGLWGWQAGCWSLWLPLLTFSPFIVDSTATLIRRSLRGAKVTEAHREHYYQRLVQMGWKHRDVALAEYALMLAVGASAIWTRSAAFPWLPLLCWGLVYFVLALWLDTRWQRHQQGAC